MKAFFYLAATFASVFICVPIIGIISSLWLYSVDNQSCEIQNIGVLFYIFLTILTFCVLLVAYIRWVLFPLLGKVVENFDNF